MTIDEALGSITDLERKRLDWDLEQGNPAFIRIKKSPEFVIGVYLEKIERLEIITTEGKWAIAKVRPRSEM